MITTIMMIMATEMQKVADMEERYICAINVADMDIYLCYSFQGSANFWTMHWLEQKLWAPRCQVFTIYTVVIIAQIW